MSSLYKIQLPIDKKKKNNSDCHDRTTRTIP